MSTVVQTGRAQKVTNKELYTEMQPKGTLLQEVIERTSKMFSCEFLILTIIINNVNFIFILFIILFYFLGAQQVVEKSGAKNFCICSVFRRLRDLMANIF